MGRPATQLPDKMCPICGIIFNRARYNGQLESASRYLQRTTCSQSCANSRLEPTHRTTFYLRAKRFKKTSCEKCRSTESLDIHHRNGNLKDNSPENIETFCHPCHMKLHWQQNPSFGGINAQPTIRIGWTDLKH